MAKKKKKEPISYASLKEATASFTKQVDRGSALIAAAWADDALEASLRCFFLPDKAILDQVFQPEGSLGTFSGRTKLAYLLGIITPSLRSDLEIIRGIRNDFAHVRQPMRFTDQTVKDRCNSLIAASAFEDGTGRIIRSPRQRFLVSAYLAAEYLVAYTENAKTHEPSLDLYYTVIHRMAKHMSLELIIEKLDELEQVKGR